MSFRWQEELQCPKGFSSRGRVLFLSCGDTECFIESHTKHSSNWLLNKDTHFSILDQGSEYFGCLPSSGLVHLPLSASSLPPAPFLPACNVKHK